ncbi:hypothetical protein CC1G_06831 [Coprinopsis cinerea okayama7|uniref:Uncharacterized protein n=1 Tax=Coprinopsis cinerea (strain Okayama-7 / 130 / ATCC MYA-4618 / FGSC 9003) TaxID=240176 RepID=A8N6V9_COPC7|nr:hypothetical protein CC1G_06831 [Coprinopsis cinerea okayama7\|eukprot:XP_001830565.2 hypothetical protein CC1G_06831 [Coprinopsis cinerea okayama7\
MRAAVDLYESPELTSSEVWSPDSNAKSRLCSVLGALSIAAVASSVAVYQFTSVLANASPKARMLSGR